MPEDREQPSPQVLTLRWGQPLCAVVGEENGQRVVHYFAGDGPHPRRSEETLRAALGVIGAWSDLDWEELADDLDRIRHESKPTPPIEFDE